MNFHSNTGQRYFVSSICYFSWQRSVFQSQFWSSWSWSSPLFSESTSTGRSPPRPFHTHLGIFTQLLQRKVTIVNTHSNAKPITNFSCSILRRTTERNWCNVNRKLPRENSSVKREGRSLIDYVPVCWIFAHAEYEVFCNHALGKVMQAIMVAQEARWKKRKKSSVPPPAANGTWGSGGELGLQISVFFNPP